MILYDKELKQMALALFIVAIIRLIYK
jgi:hypothetical protein